MSIRAPMQVSPSGLVFYYDTFNPKSYKGKPTTNLLTYTNFGNNSNNWYSYCGNGNGITNNTTEVLAPDGTYTATKVVRGTSGACDWTYNGWGLLFSDGTNIFTSGQTYTVSIWARCDTGTMSFILGLNDSHSSGFTITTNWQRITFTATATGLDRGLQFITYDTSGRTYYVWGPQSELGTYATQYTPSGASRGTRTVTNGLVDLNENYTINLTNAEYDNSADITYSSTGVLTAGNLGSGYTNYSIECWFNSSDIVNYRNVFDMNYTTYSPNTGNVGPRLEQYSNGTISTVWSGNTTNNNLYNNTNQFSISANRYNHFVMTCSGGTMNFYLNGQLVQSGVSSAQGYVTSFADARIGVGFALDGSRYFRGKIPKFAVYNRVLTSSEVLRNYNSAKSRYGL